MMVIENDCVGCQIYCINCSLSRTPHYYCDKCGCEAEEMFYDANNIMLCADCICEDDETDEVDENYYVRVDFDD